MKLLLLVFLCLLPLAWPRGYLVTVEEIAKTPSIDNIVDEDGSDYTVDEDGSEYTDENDEVKESKPTKTTCEEFPKLLPKICKKIEDGTIKKGGKDYIGGLEAPWRRDMLQMDMGKILDFQKQWEILSNPEDNRLVSARVDKSSR